MTRTVTALYQDRADADAALSKLKAAGLGDNVDIHDQAAAADGSSRRDGETFMDWLRNLFGGHDDVHTYAEGVRRGHFLLTAKVDDLRATEAAELLDATTAVNLADAQAGWRMEGWTGQPTNAGDSAYTPGARSRSYLTDGSTAVPTTLNGEVGEGVVARDTYVRGPERQSTVDIGDVRTPGSGTAAGTSRPV